MILRILLNIFIGILAEDVSKLSPTIFVPGILGTRLQAKLDRDWVPHYICSKRSDWFTIWMNYEIIAPLSGTCWVENLRLQFDPKTNITFNADGVEIRTECFGTTDCIEWLDPHHMIPAGRYFHDIIQSFVRNGYEVNNTLKAATYDWRKSPSEHKIFFDDLKAMTEEMFEKFNRKVLFVAHSMGNPTLVNFFNLQTEEWKNKHVKMWAAIAPVFMGAPKSLKGLISGENDGIPRILVGMIQMRTLLRTFPSSYYLIPSIPADHPDSWPAEFRTIVQTDSKNYTISTEDLSELFDLMEIDDYNNASQKYQLWSKERILKPPNVDLHIFYGTGLDTPCAFDYTNRRFPDYMPNEVVCTGDSTVPEFSSTYPINRWPNVKSTEVARADHNELLRDEEVIETILAYAIDDYEPPTRNKLRFKPDLTNGARIFDRVYKRPAL